MTQADSDNPPNSVQQLSLKALGLRNGIALQVRKLVEGASKKEGQLFGAIENRGVMVGPQGPEGEDTARLRRLPAPPAGAGEFRDNSRS